MTKRTKHKTTPRGMSRAWAYAYLAGMVIFALIWYAVDGGAR